MHKTQIKLPEPKSNSFTDLKLGQFAKTRYDGQLMIVLRIHDRIVSITHPEHYWDLRATNMCEILPRETVISLTIQ